MSFKVILIALYVINAFARILIIGDERKPITPLGAALGLLVDIALVAGIIFYL